MISITKAQDGMRGYHTDKYKFYFPNFPNGIDSRSGL